MLDKYLLYINGEFRNSSDDRTFDAVNPADETVFATIAHASIQDTKDAIESARHAFDSGVWNQMNKEDRSRIIKQVVDKINENAKKLVELEVKDSGSTKKKAQEDIFLSAKSLNYYSKVAMMNFEEVAQDASKEGFNKSIIRKEPVGVVSAIIPWNFPLKMAIWKLGPALAAGCTVVLKPAMETSVTALELAKLISETDMPAGVVNIITGDADVGTEMVTNPKVDKIAFTGSTEVGKIVMQNASSTLKNITLECGGKSANIVIDDADLSIAVDGAIYAGFYHQGQCCEGGTRLLVHENIYNQFNEKLKEKIEKMKIGDPMDKTVDVGPVVSKEQFDKVMSYIKLGLEEGATLLTGGERSGDKGFFIKPTIFIDTNNKMKISREEIFGPVINVIKFSSDEDAVNIANDSIFGLGGAVWSANEDRAMNIAKDIRTGTVWINEYHLLNDKVPFGGYKQSGIGREFGTEGMNEYLEVKHIYVDEIKDRSKKTWYNTVVPQD
jgi:acyl-CoA reductase-like NAD-dependent aldehyde dehydrogenase